MYKESRRLQGTMSAKDLLNELLIECFSYLNIDNLRSVSRTCKAWSFCSLVTIKIREHHVAKWFLSQHKKYKRLGPNLAIDDGSGYPIAFLVSRGNPSSDFPDRYHKAVSHPAPYLFDTSLTSNISIPWCWSTLSACHHDPKSFYISHLGDVVDRCIVKGQNITAVKLTIDGTPFGSAYLCRASTYVCFHFEKILPLISLLYHLCKIKVIADKIEYLQVRHGYLDGPEQDICRVTKSR